MSSKSYTVTPAQIAAFQQELGLPDGNRGQFSPPSHPEITLGYVYDGAATLTVTILDKAFYETSGEIWAAIDPYFVK